MRDQPGSTLLMAAPLPGTRRAAHPAGQHRRRPDHRPATAPALTAMPAAPGPGAPGPHRPAHRADPGRVQPAPAPRRAGPPPRLARPGPVRSQPGAVPAARHRPCPLWRVYSPGTLAAYATAITRGHRPSRPAEDIRQLGGDAIMADGTIRLLWRPRTPDDRPAASDVVAAARRWLTRQCHQRAQ